MDWAATTHFPKDGLEAAIARDEQSTTVDDNHFKNNGPRSHLQFNVLYAVFGAE